MPLAIFVGQVPSRMVAPLFLTSRCSSSRQMTGSAAFSIELGAVGFFDPADVAREFDRRHLHAEAEPEVRHFVFAGETRRA